MGNSEEVEKYVGGIIDKALYKSGVGLEHEIEDVEAVIGRRGLALKVNGRRILTLGDDEIDRSNAKEFVVKLNSLKGD